MKNKFLKLMALFVASAFVGNAGAQTDVTSTYLINPSFEYSAEGEKFSADTKELNNGEAIYGWTGATISNSNKNIQVTKTAPNTAFGTTSASDGDYYYFIRQGWEDKSSSITQSVSLPEGRYYLSVDYKQAEAHDNNKPFRDSKVGLTITKGEEPLATLSTGGAVNAPGASYFTDIAWKQIGTWFDVEDAGDVTIALTFALNGTYKRADLCLDNVKLYKWDLDEQKNYDNASNIRPMDVTSKFVTNPYFDTNISGWTSTTGAQNRARATNQHGAISGGFFENWNGSSIASGKIYQTLNGLVEGTYRVTISAFGTQGTPNLKVYAGYNSVDVTSETPLNYSVNVGVYGTNSLEIGLEVQSGNGSKWIGIDNIKLEYLGYDASIAMTAVKEKLTATIASVADLNTTVNVGDKPFQIPSSAVTTLVNAVKTANEALNAEDATTESYTEANTALEEAIAAYKNVGLNAPSEDETFNIVLKFDGWDYDGKAVTYIENGRPDAGLYNIQYLIEPNVNYAQAFTFTPVEGKANHYTLSMTDVDGNERYISTGVPYGGNTSQIRTTTDATKALAVKVIATTTDGIWNLHNTEANNYIGSQDEGVYTVNSHIDFALKPAAKAEVTLKVTDLGWATLMLPFNAEIPTGLEVWSCTGEENGVLTLEEVESIVANTPYVVSGEAGEYTFADYGLAKQDAYAGTMFTGTYAETHAPVGSYVLQNGVNGFGFYKVAEGKQPTVGAYRCYINASKSAAPMFSLERGEGTTSIEDAELTNENVVIYDLAGRRVEKMEKGIYIANGKKVIR